MNEAVLDSSALVAFLLREPGADRVAGVLGRAVMSAANLAEVLSRSADRSADPAVLDAQLRVLPLRVIPFGREDALAAARLRDPTRQVGLTFGGRCCLALALRLGLP